MNKNQQAFFVDVTRCINCKTCEIACKDINHADMGQRLRKVRTIEGGEYPKVYAYNISMSCNHCEEPACLTACPAKAYTKREEDGIVVHDPERCIGCKLCTWACPYGAPQYSQSLGKIKKCNMCLGNISEGEQPACVASCPLRAIEVGKLANFENRHDVTIAIRHIPSPRLTKPSARYKVKPEARKGGNG